MIKDIIFISRNDLKKRFDIDDFNTIFALSSQLLWNMFSSYERVIISNAPIYINLVLFNYCHRNKIPILILVDSILEPAHLSLWPRWKKQNITGAFQMLSDNVVHPLSPLKENPVPKEIKNYMKSDRNKPNKEKIVVGITISNKPASNNYDKKILREYFQSITVYLEENKIEYLIRDRNNFFKDDIFFKQKINSSNDSSLEEYLNSISHLITVPGTLVLLAGISKIHVAQVILSNMFCNTPSTFLINPESTPSNWVPNFIKNNTINHKFQDDYYNYFAQRINNSNINKFKNKDFIKLKSNKFIFFKFISSLLYRDIKGIIKSLLKK